MHEPLCYGFGGDKVLLRASSRLNLNTYSMSRKLCVGHLFN